MKPRFKGGPNIAMKVPPHQHTATVAFYRDVLALEVLETSTDDTVVFKFGNSKLWIDKVNTVSQAEIWLQVLTDDSAGADRLLNKAGIARCDEIEPLPDGFDGFWISNPASIVHLIDGAGSP